MKLILKDFEFLVKKVLFSEKKLLKKRIIRAINNKYEKEIGILPKLIKKNSETIDVGVYRGVYSYELARLSRHLHAFEANPIIFKYLDKNLTKIIKNITLYNCALSNKKGTTSLRVPIRRKTFFKSQFEERYKIGLGTIQNTNTFDSFEKFEVNTIKLDNLEFKNNISFIKIDVEGHEIKVIDGAKDTIKKHKPNLLVEIEERHSKEKLIDSINYIKSLNYKSYIYKDNNLLEIKDFQNLKEEINFIFIQE